MIFLAFNPHDNVDSVFHERNDIIECLEVLTICSCENYLIKIDVQKGSGTDSGI